jgi:hypothetical protein
LDRKHQSLEILNIVTCVSNRSSKNHKRNADGGGQKGLLVKKDGVIKHSDLKNKPCDVNCELVNTNDMVHDDNLLEISLDLN